MLEIIGIIVVAAIASELYQILKEKYEKEGKITVGDSIKAIATACCLILHPIIKLVEKLQDSKVLDMTLVERKDKDA